jgi:hypothetical protein
LSKIVLKRKGVSGSSQSSSQSSSSSTSVKKEKKVKAVYNDGNGAVDTGFANNNQSEGIGTMAL